MTIIKNIYEVRCVLTYVVTSLDTVSCIWILSSISSLDH